MMKLLVDFVFLLPMIKYEQWEAGKREETFNIQIKRIHSQTRTHEFRKLFLFLVSP